MPILFAIALGIIMIDLTSTLDEAKEKQITYPWVIISISNKLFGISSEMVSSMELLPNITEVPHSPNYMRGMIESRNKMLPLIDTRVKLGYLSLADEMQDLSKLFVERRKDHENWLNELETSVKEKRSFRLTTDPHQCKFGKWYDNFKTDNFAFQHLLKKFKTPHEKIHNIAVEVTQLVKEDNIDAAQTLINTTRGTTLAEMIHLFEKASQIVTEETREIMLVVELQNKDIAMTVDTVTSVEYLAEDSIQDIPTSNTEEAKFSSKIGKRSNGKENVILLDFNKIDIQGITNLVHTN